MLFLSHVLFCSTEDAPIDKPIVLWSLYFNQAIPDSSCVTADLPSNVHVSSLPGVTIGFGEALQQVCELREHFSTLTHKGG